LHLAGDAVLIAEDVLQQTYYLGSVDYYLREFDRSYNYAVIRRGRPVDQYTGVPVVGTDTSLKTSSIIVGGATSSSSAAARISKGANDYFVDAAFKKCSTRNGCRSYTTDVTARPRYGNLLTDPCVESSESGQSRDTRTLFERNSRKPLAGFGIEDPMTTAPG
jgi:hypothetical protein